MHPVVLVVAAHVQRMAVVINVRLFMVVVQEPDGIGDQQVVLDKQETVAGVVMVLLDVVDVVVMVEQAVMVEQVEQVGREQ